MMASDDEGNVEGLDARNPMTVSVTAPYPASLNDETINTILILDLSFNVIAKGSQVWNRLENKCQSKSQQRQESGQGAQVISNKGITPDTCNRIQLLDKSLLQQETTIVEIIKQVTWHIR